MKKSILLRGATLALALAFSSAAFGQVSAGIPGGPVNPGSTGAAANQPQGQSVAPAMAPGAMSQDELRNSLNARFPAGLSIPNPGDGDKVLPPRFYRAGDMVTTGVTLPNGVVMRYSMEELGNVVKQNISACNYGVYWKARLAQRRASNEEHARREQKRYKQGQVIGDVAHVAGAGATVGAAAAFIGGSYAGVVAPMAIVGLIDHFIHRADRKTAHENNVDFRMLIGDHLDEKEGWINTMVGDVYGDGSVPDGWCGVFRRYELQYGNDTAAEPEVKLPNERRKKRH